jgi:dihydrofolate reductase
MSINAILAMDEYMGIGFENGLPWPTNKKDMAWFSDNTRGHVVVMGRKTWESLGSHPLPNRINIVVSSQDVEGPDAVLSGDMGTILQQLENRHPDLHIWVIGGADIYRQALPHCDKIYVTRIKGVYRCDTFMYNRDFEGFNNLDYIDDDENINIQIRSRS